MQFLKQIKFEIKNIIRSKFLLIIGILIILAGIAIPIIGLLTQNKNNGNNYPIEPTLYRTNSTYSEDGKIAPDGPGKDLESITVNGVTITADNPFYWQLQNLVSEKTNFESNSGQFSSSEVVDLLLESVEWEIVYYLRFAQSILTYEDYRMDLAWRGQETLSDKFFYEHSDVDEKILIEAASYRKGVDPQTFRTKFIDITDQQRAEALAKTNENLDLLYAIIENNDFVKYIDLQINLKYVEIKNLEDNIAIQVQSILDNPDQEDNLNQYIEDMKKQIQIIKTNSIPLLEYRLEKNIIPGTNVWQNLAISDIENSRSQLVYTTIMTEEEFNQNYQGGGKKDGGIIAESMPAISYGKGFYPDYWYGGSYDTYQEYVTYMQKQINKLNSTINVAQKSLDSGKPDMKYVPNGARNRTVQYLNYSIIVALFGVLLGGWLIASEHQQGTIRLLMIRPKTRIKILLAKFTAAILVCLVVYIAGSVLNFITNGICFGFADYGFPNYNAGGAVGFISYLLPKLLICILPILFAFTIAFMLSVVVKNIAVSIAIPFVFFVGSIIVMSIMAYSPSMAWLVYTPIPFIMISQFFQQNSIIQYAMEAGNVSISLAYGAALLFVLSVICTVISVLVFKKKDIVN